MPSLNELNTYLASIGLAPAAAPAGVNPAYNPNPGISVTGQPISVPMGTPIGQGVTPSMGVASAVAPVNTGLPAIMPTSSPGGVAGVGKVNLSWLLPIISSLAVIPVIGDWLAGIGDAAIISFDALPGPLQDAIILAFAAVGSAIVKGAGTLIVNDVLGLGGHVAAAKAALVPPGFIASWKANGVQFYRNNATGKLGVLNHKGRFKQWKPRRPVVIFSTGAHSLRSFLRAERILSKQARAISRTIARHVNPPPRRTPSTRRRIAAPAEVIELEAGRRR